MALALYFHPFSSFCQKVLIALYENDVPFEPHVVDLGDEAASAAFRALWPIGQFPVLRDLGRDLTLPESSIIIEYLAERFPGGTELVPKDPELALQVRLWDRFFDLHVGVPMQKVVTDRVRPAGKGDPFGVEQAKVKLRTAYRLIEAQVSGQSWAVGDAFSMADCAAAPSLYYANLALPFGQGNESTARYLERLLERPSFARAVEEARPYRHLFPR
jgi:glutathione S-transferase